MATMHPLLFLGLGGTGGKVLGVVQNTLSRRLRSVGIHHIPAGIQFLHIDVPAKRDADEGGQAFGLAPTDYFPLTDENSTYSATYTHLDRLFRSSDGNERPFQSWAPRPTTVPEATASGARQMRAYGRVVALGVLTRIRQAIENRLDRCRNGRDQLNPAAEALGIAGLDTPAEKPIVIVIGSLAGGSGAGLIGDILDLLRSLGVGKMVTNLFSPDVYAGLGAGNAGIAPNALTTICELIAQDYDPGQGTAGGVYMNTRHAIFSGQHLPSAVVGGAEAYYLVGASSQRGTVFSRPQDVYRVVGSMYAELALNPALLDSLDAYLLTNFPTAKQSAPDHLGITSRETHDNPNLMGLGFGRLSVGREFFAQYAHDRLMRLVTEQLLEAHLEVSASERDKSDDVLLNEAVERNYTGFIWELQLNELDLATTQNDDIYNQVSIRGTEEYKSLNTEFASRLMSDIEAIGRGSKVSTQEALRVAHTAAKLEINQVAADSGTYNPLRNRAHHLFMKGLEKFELDVAQRLRQLLPEQVADFGLPVVIKMLELLRDQLLKAAAQLKDQADKYETNAHLMLDDLERGRASMVRSFRRDDYDTIRDIVTDAGQPIDVMVYSDELRKTGRLVADMATGLVNPWLRSLRSARDGLRDRVDMALDGGGTLRTMWPSETGGVPAYLRPSAVEFTLEDISGFPQLFREQIASRMPRDMDDLSTQLAGPEQVQRQALKDAVRDMITGMRDDATTGTRVAWTASPVVSQVDNWVSRLRDESRARDAVVRLAFTLEDIDNRVIDWLNDPNASTRRFLDCTLREYLNPAPNTVTDQEIRRRHDKMVTQFAKLLVAAEPLVRLNLALYAQVHAPQPQINLILGAIDVPTLDPVIQARLGTAPLTQRLQAEAQQLLPNGRLNTDGAPSPSITLLSTTASPFNLVVADSILGPISQAADAVSATGWLNRRSRPLAEYVPLSPETQTRLLQGLFVGRLMGEVELTPQYPGPNSLLVRNGTGGWWEVDLTGLRGRHRTAPHRDYPGRFLESYITSLVEAFRLSSLEPLLPFQKLHALGQEHTSYPYPLQRWIDAGGDIPGTRDPFVLKNVPDRADREAKVRKAFADLRTSLDELVSMAPEGDPHHLATLDIIDLLKGALTELESGTRSTEGRY